MDSRTYDELHGSNNWEGLLDPLDHSLRTLILGYGDLSAVAELAFNDHERSKYNGYSYYGKSSFFKGVMLPWADSKYEVASFLYTTARIDSRLALLVHGMSRQDSEYESNWMGYVAVSNDEFSKSIGRREICVVWRGTVQSYEWMNDVLGANLVPAEPLIHENDEGTNKLQVMEGWLTIYNTSDPNSEFVKSSARTQLLAQIKELLIKYKDEKVSITCTGHSLGACLAVLSAFDLATNITTPPSINVSAFVFACPQVGNNAFKSKIEKLPNLKILRVKNDPDMIPFWPSKIRKLIDEKTWLSVPSIMMDYVDVGIEMLIDSKKSPYLKDESGMSGLSKVQVHHNILVMLHTLGGWNGKNNEFDLSLSKRNLSTVNMVVDILKDEFKIPASWWVEKNKGMVLNDDGDWVLLPLDLDDHGLPVYE